MTDWFKWLLNKSINSMNEKNIFYPEHNLISSLKQNKILLSILCLNMVFLLLFCIMKSDITLEYTYVTSWRGQDKQIIANELIFNIRYYIILLLLFHTLYFIPFLKSFILNMKHVKIIEKKKKILIEKLRDIITLSPKNVILNDNGELEYFDEKIIERVINERLYEAGMAIYYLLRNKNFNLNMFLTNMMLIHKNNRDYNILKDNYNIFIKNTISNEMEINNNYLDFIYFNENINNMVYEYKLKIDILFNFLLDIQKYSRIISKEYIVTIINIFEYYFSYNHHGCIDKFGKTGITFNNVFNEIFNVSNPSCNYELLVSNSLKYSNIPLLRELYYLNKYDLRINIELMNEDSINKYRYRSENYFSSLSPFLSINKLVDIPNEQFCFLDNYKITTIFPQFINYLYKEQVIDNIYFKFIINKEGFIYFLSSLYKYKEIVFSIYSNCICCILEDSILSDYEELIINSTHTWESMYMLLRHFNMLVKEEAKKEYKITLSRILDEIYLHFTIDYKSKDGYSIPSLINLILHEIDNEVVIENKKEIIFT